MDLSGSWPPLFLAPAHPIRTRHIRRRKQAHRVGGVQQPKGSEDEVMQSLEFQAMTHQAGRTAAPAGTQLIQTPAQRQRQAPQRQRGLRQRAAPTGYRLPLFFFPRLPRVRMGLSIAMPAMTHQREKKYARETMSSAWYIKSS